MLRRNKLTKTLAVPIATGAAALGVLAGSVLTATSANAASLLWDVFKTTPLIQGNTKITYVSDTFAAGVLPAGTNVELNSSGTSQFLFDPPGEFKGTGTFTYIIELTDPSKYFSGVQTDATVANDPGYGIINTTVTGAASVLASLNGWPVPGEGDFAPLSGTLGTLTVINQLPVPGGASYLNSLSNVFRKEPIPPTSVPEPGTILGLLTVGGLGLVSRFKR